MVCDAAVVAPPVLAVAALENADVDVAHCFVMFFLVGYSCSGRQVDRRGWLFFYIFSFILWN